MQTEEVWRAIPGLNDDAYEVSNHGRIRSLKNTSKGYILKTQPGAGGETLVVYANGVRVGLSVGRAVALAFIGEPAGPKMYARHLNGDTTDNRPENLAWRAPGRKAKSFA